MTAIYSATDLGISEEQALALNAKTELVTTILDQMEYLVVPSTMPGMQAHTAYDVIPMVNAYSVRLEQTLYQIGQNSSMAAANVAQWVQSRHQAGNHVDLEIVKRVEATADLLKKYAAALAQLKRAMVQAQAILMPVLSNLQTVGAAIAREQEADARREAEDKKGTQFVMPSAQAERN